MRVVERIRMKGSGANAVRAGQLRKCDRVGGATERGYAPVLSIMETICVTRQALAAVTVTIL
mgnify:FL=1|tara:strand:+ start:231 stop:416 length:186 start_codon:yes stop_codon:yes gene_type:complete